MSSTQETIACAECGDTGRGTNEMQAETEGGTEKTVTLCDICYPDFWDEIGPGEFTHLDHANEDVRQPYWHCQHCDSVYSYKLMRTVRDTEYEPEVETVVCAFCVKRDKDGRYQPLQQK